jgi:hypothetical protein
MAGLAAAVGPGMSTTLKNTAYVVAGTRVFALRFVVLTSWTGVGGLSRQE